MRFSKGKDKIHIFETEQGIFRLNENTSRHQCNIKSPS